MWGRKENILLCFLSLLQYLSCSLKFPQHHPLAGCSVAEVQSIALLSLIALLRCGGDGKSHQLKALCWEELSTKM